MIIKFDTKKALFSFFEELILIGISFFLAALFLFDALLFYIWLGDIGVFGVSTVVLTYFWVSIMYKLNKNER